MNKPIYFLLILVAAIGFSCQVNDCDQLPETYQSYEQASETIKAARFKIKESVNTSNSSWIRAASYYSCDGRSGFFIFLTDKKEYIHSDVPISIWNGFKTADSFGSYYNRNIKNRYFFNALN